MTVASPPERILSCPSCNTALGAQGDGPLQCPVCTWKGEAYFFAPTLPEAKSGELALSDDSVCVHHPTKKATAICAGSGDYICDLCAVQINGQTFSAQYLSNAGKKAADKAFDLTVARPDRVIAWYLAMPFIPYVNFLAIPLAFIWLPHGFVLYMRCLRMKREDPLFARLFGPVAGVLLPTLLVIWSLAWIVGVAAVVLYFLDRK